MISILHCTQLAYSKQLTLQNMWIRLKTFIQFLSHLYCAHFRLQICFLKLIQIEIKLSSSCYLTLQKDLVLVVRLLHLLSQKLGKSNTQNSILQEEMPLRITQHGKLNKCLARNRFNQFYRR